jgi:hypothetical protein
MTGRDAERKELWWDKQYVRAFYENKIKKKWVIDVKSAGAYLIDNAEKIVASADLDTEEIGKCFEIKIDFKYVGLPSITVAQTYKVRDLLESLEERIEKCRKEE